MIMGRVDLENYVQNISDTSDGEKIFNCFMFLGISIAVVGLASAPASTLLWGYFIIIFSIIGLFFLKIDITKNNTVALKILMDPLLLLIIILFWNISLNLRFYNEINSNTLSREYKMWSGMSIALVAAMIIISMVGYFFKDVYESQPYLVSYSYILLVLNLIVTAIEQIVLENFTVDGFSIGLI